MVGSDDVVSVGVKTGDGSGRVGLHVQYMPHVLCSPLERAEPDTNTWCGSYFITFLVLKPESHKSTNTNTVGTIAVKFTRKQAANDGTQI